MFKIMEAVNRNRAKEQGFYDGRFRSKIEGNKKKEVHKVFRKNKVSINDYKL